MKPTRLELSGFKSYKENTIIDFEILTEKKVFGIFGNNGSGKSAILEAIVLAIYGNTSKDEDKYINNDCDKAQIVYEFEIRNKNLKRKYRIKRIFIRGINGIKNSKAILAEIRDRGHENIIEDNELEVNKKIIEIIGLTENEFIGTVIIPQSKFNKFLKLGSSERRQLLEKIFDLEEYGTNLINKVGEKKEQEQKNQKRTKKEKNKYTSVSDLDCKNKEKEIERSKQLKVKKSEDLNLLIERYNQYKNIYEQQNILEKYEKIKRELDLKKEVINNKKKQLKDAINADKINPHINIAQQLDKKRDEETFKLDFITTKSKKLKKELLVVNEKYEEAYKLKNDELSNLNEEKTKLERAKELEKELISIEKELRTLKKINEILTNKKEEINKLELDSQSNKNIYIKSIKEIEDRVDNLSVSWDEKQKILIAHEREKEDKNIIESLEKKKDKLDKLDKELEKLNAKSRYLERDKRNLSDKLVNIKEDYENLIKRCPGNSEDIVNKAEYVIDLKLKLSFLKTNEEEKNKLQKELNELLEKRYKYERDIKIYEEKVDSAIRSISDLEQEIDRLKYLNLAGALKKELRGNNPCPVCGSIHYDNRSNIEKDAKLITTKEKLEKLKEEQKHIILKTQDLNIKYINSVSLEQIKTRNLEEIKSKIGELKYNEMYNRLQEEQRALNLLKTNVSKWNEEHFNLEAKINRISEEKYNTEKEEIKLKENIIYLKNYTKELKEEIDRLQVKSKTIGDEYLRVKSTLKIPNISQRLDEINENEKVIEDLNNQHIKIFKNKEIADDDIRIYQTQIHQIDLDLIKNNEQCEEKGKAKEIKYRELMSITKGKSSAILLDNIEEKIKNIITREEVNKKKLEVQRIEFEKYSSEKYNIEGWLKKSEEELNIHNSIINQLLVDYEFNNIYEVKKSILNSDRMRLLHSEIMEYNEEYRLLDTNIKNMKEYLLGRRTTDEEIRNMQDTIYNIKVEIENLKNQIEVGQKELIRLREQKEVTSQLDKQLKECDNKLSLLDELYEVIKENEFVDYIAKNKLESIAYGATRKLELITRGRYKLKINDQSEFMISDNFNGGFERSVNTLSGGEEFLVSLCLALELTSKMNLKGKYPLEIAFIDEGFEALDEENLHIVREALKKLQDNNTNIGIVSHVKEFKDIIPRKLMIENHYKTGSKVSIEYN